METLPGSSQTATAKGRSLNGQACFRWIAFDAVGTLIYPDPPVATVYFEAARRHGSKLTAADISQRFKQVFRQTERNDIEDAGQRGQLTTSDDRERERWREIVARVVDDVRDTSACFDELFVHFSRLSAWRCFDDVAPSLHALHTAGYRLAIASNFDNRLHALCDEFTELQPIECRVISAEVGYRKPSPRFYEALLHATGCAAPELLMVGDDLENDILGAREAGIAALLINRRGDSQPGELSELGDILTLCTAAAKSAGTR